MPGSGGSTPRRVIRGDIHSSLPFVSSPSYLAGQQRRRQPPGSSGLRSSSPAGRLDSESDSATLTVNGDDDDEAMNGGAPAAEEDDSEVFLWGTTIRVGTAYRLMTDFFRNFKRKYRAKFNEEQRAKAIEAGQQPEIHNPLYDSLSEEKAEETLYLTYLRTMRSTQQTNLNLDLLNILAYPPTAKLYYQILAFPQEMIPIMDNTVKDLLLDLTEEDARKASTTYERDLLREDMSDIEGTDYRCRPFGGSRTVNMRDLNPGDTDTLVTIKGLVIRATPVIPDMKIGFFRCAVCQHTVNVEIDRGRIEEPAACPREQCNSKGTMTLIHNRCIFMDKQVIRLQETPDVVPDGQTPYTVSICAYDELVDLVKPGDRVTLTGVFRSVPVRLNPRQRSIKALFKTYVDVVHVKRTNVVRMGFDPSTRQGEGRPPGVGIGGEHDEEEGLTAIDREDSDVVSPMAELEAKIKELSRRPDIYATLARSMAPSIWEMDDVKKGILLQLFGGTNKSIARGGGGGGPRYRGDINILMVGDPGTSKSQILSVSRQTHLKGDCVS